MNDNLREREVFEAWAKENGYGNSMLKTHAKAGWDTAIEANTPAVPDCRVVDRGFRWDADRQEHVPTLVIEFDAVPLNSPYDAKGWTDRDALAAMLAAAPQPQPVAQPLDPWSVEEDYFAWVTTSATTWDAFLAGVRLAENAHSIKPANQQKE